MWQITLGIIFLLYFTGIELFTGAGTRFYFVWAVMGIILLALGIASKKGYVERFFPIFVRRGAMVLAFLVFVLFLIVEVLILSGFTSQGEKGLDTIIVLGAQVKTSGPSKVLKMRLDRAYDYLAENEKTTVIVSGGQGKNEPESEAECMKRYLMEKGIEGDRIQKEDQSVNTTQNLIFSKKLINQERAKVGIVSNNFHIFRSVKIAQKSGYYYVSGIAAPSDILLQPNNMLREFFGVMKDFLFGNM